MKTYKVLSTKTALQDLYAIKDYIAIQLSSPETAAKQFNRIVQKIFSLKTFPARHPLFLKHDNQDFHKILVDNYSVMYI